MQSNCIAFAGLLQKMKKLQSMRCWKNFSNFVATNGTTKEPMKSLLEEVLSAKAEVTPRKLNTIKVMQVQDICRASVVHLHLQPQPQLQLKKAAQRFPIF